MFFIFGLPMDSLVISLTSEISSEPKLKWALVLFLPNSIGFHYDNVQTNKIIYLFLVCFYYL